MPNKVLNSALVGRAWWPAHSLELPSALLESILEKLEIHKVIQMITKRAPVNNVFSRTIETNPYDMKTPYIKTNPYDMKTPHIETTTSLPDALLTSRVDELIRAMFLSSKMFWEFILNLETGLKRREGVIL